MAELFENIGFSHKALFNDFKILDAVLTNLFNRPLLIRLFIHCEINNAHTALSDFIQYFILAVNK